MLHLIFYAFSAVAVLSALNVITTHNPVRSVLSLVVTFFAMAGVWMILHAEFLAIILVLVYVGAVMTLFLFVVMMLNIDRETKQSGFVNYLPYGVVIVGLMTGLTLFAVGPDYFGMSAMPAPAAYPTDYSNIETIGNVLYTDYVYPFEIAGVILLAAIIASITLSHRPPHRRKVQNIDKQIATERARSVTLVRFENGNPVGELPPTPISSGEA